MCRVDGKGRCDRQSVTYDIKCTTKCNDIYIRKKSRSACTRGLQRMKSLAKKEDGSTVKRNTKVKCKNLK